MPKRQYKSSTQNNKLHTFQVHTKMLLSNSH